MNFIAMLVLAHGALGAAGFESDHFPAEFWQREDGSYNVRVIDADNAHLFIFDRIYHDPECGCEIN
jgi:hypothetical protein